MKRACGRERDALAELASATDQIAGDTAVGRSE
jgi:hypothetical protein